MPGTSDPPVPPHVICRQFLTDDIPPGSRTLDVGCGSGDLMMELQRLGAEVVGVEIESTLSDACRRRGLDVRDGMAEQLPFEDGTFDRIVCSVVVPYTDESRTIAEWARTLKPGGRIYATYHGLGYGLNYFLEWPHPRRQFYGLRMLINTCYYWITGRRIRGFLGDTLCQGVGRLRAYYHRFGLILERELLIAGELGLPHFICHQLAKSPAAAVTPSDVPHDES